MTRRFTINLLAILVLLIASLQLNAQQSTTNGRFVRKCGVDEAMERLFQKYPEMRAQYAAQELQLRKAMESKAGKTLGPSPTYTIPIVVHVFHTGQTEGALDASLSNTIPNPTAAQLKASVDQVNKDYAAIGTNPDGKARNSRAREAAIKLCLATKGFSNPQGTGTIIDYPLGAITRWNGAQASTWTAAGLPSSYAAAFASEGVNGSGVPEADLKQVVQWDVTKYYNIYLVTELEGNDGGSGTQGFAYYPNNSTTDYAVMIPRAFDGTQNSISTFDHELGHALNIKHTWEGGASDGSTCPPVESNCAAEGDFICDIPRHQSMFSDFTPCYPDGQTGSCGAGVYGDYQDNYMNYTNCSETFFSQGQVDRMRAVLSTMTSSNRYKQVLPTNVTACGCDGNSKPYAIIEVDNPTPCVGLAITLKDASLYSPTSWQWSVISGSPFTFVTPSTSQNPQISFGGTGPYVIRLSVTNTNGTDATSGTRDYVIRPQFSSTLPIVETFTNGQSFPPTGWKRTTTAGATQWTKARNNSPATNSKDSCALLPDPKFGPLSYSNLDTKPLNFTGVNVPQISYWRAYRVCFSNPADSLVVQVSQDCGASFTTVKTYTFQQLRTVTSPTGCGTPPTYSDYLDYAPVAGSTADWRKDSIDLSSYSNKNNIIVRFQRRGYDNGSNGFLFLDDINVKEMAPCTYALQPPSRNFTPLAQSGTITFTTGPVCTWTAMSTCSFVTVTNPSGTGPATVNYTITANPTPNVRTCEIIINGQNHVITQDGSAGCFYSLLPATASFTSTGGNGSFNLNTTSTCTWAASTSCTFVTVNTPTGTGSAVISYTIAPNTSANARTCDISVNGQTHVVTQAGITCTYAITPPTATYTNTGNMGTITVSAPPTCSWTVSSACTFVSINNFNGVGNGTVTYTVAANSTNSSRSCTITVNGMNHNVIQDGTPTGCSYVLTPSARSFNSNGGNGTVNVNTGSSCTWMASSTCSFVTIANGSGPGSGTVSYTVTANTSTSARSCNIIIAGQLHTVSQAGVSTACNYVLQPTNRNFTPSGGPGTISVNTTSNCTWTPSSTCTFVTITNGTGTGSGTVSYTVAVNNGPARSCGIIIAGNSHLITQEAAVTSCTYAVNPPGSLIVAAGGNGQFTINTGPTCTWAVTNPCAYISVAPSIGTGPATVNYNVQANTTPNIRICTITVNGQTHVVEQEGASGACTYGITPPSATFNATGGNGNFNLSTGASCTWTTSPNCSFVTMTNNSGVGSSSIGYTVAPNSGPARACTIFAGGQMHTISQNAGSVTCNYTTQPPSRNFTASGGSNSVTLTTDPTCTWTASASCSYVSINNAIGTGPANVVYTVSANSGPARTCFIFINNQTHVVTQDAATVTCTYAVTPLSAAYSKNGGVGTVNVITDPSCAWTVSAACSFVTPSTTGGAGSGPVTYNVAGNLGPARSCTLVIGGVQHVITQEANTSGLIDLAAFGLDVRPNPASSRFEMNLRKDDEQTQASVYSVLGQKMQELRLNKGINTVDVSAWPRGIYFIQFKRTSGEQLRHKLIVE